MEQDEGRGRVPWTGEEDDKLRDYVNTHGPHHWDAMARYLGIGRSGNSCRLRWLNYLCPHIRRGEFSDEEALTILNLLHQFGNRWSTIATELAGRTDNDIKNLWNTQLVKEAKQHNCNVNSEEFLLIMSARLSERINSMGGTTSFLTVSTLELNDDGPIPISDEFWATLGSICDLDIDPNLDG